MKLGVCNEIFQEWDDFERTCDYVADVGYEGIEIAPFTFAPHVKDITKEHRDKIVKCTKENDLDVIGLHWLLVGPEGLHVTCPDDEVRKTTAEYLLDLVHLCGEIGGTRMIFGSPMQRNIEEGQQYQEAFDNSRRVFEHILPACEEYGITFCMEQLSKQETNFCQTAEETVDLIDSINHPNFQLLLDVKAMVDEPAGRADTIKKYKKYLKHFHANDENLKGPGFGDVDFEPIFGALKEIEYDGYVSVEVFDFEVGCVAIAGQSYEYMKRFV
jgi:sugar phosphate isomerase/epimerase